MPRIKWSCKIDNWEPLRRCDETKKLSMTNEGGRLGSAIVVNNQRALAGADS